MPLVPHVDSERTNETDPNWGQGASHPNFVDTQQLRALSANARQAELLVLSRDAALIDIVRTAAPGIVRVSDAPDLDRAVERLPGVEFGVLVVDVSTGTDLTVMLPQLTQNFPEIVVVAAGRREQVSSLMNLTAAGRIFRFLLLPLAHGQTRLALGAAIAQHLGMKATNQRVGDTSTASGGSKYVTTYGALGVGLLATIVAIWFGVRKFTEEPAAQVSPAVVQPATLPNRPDPVQAELKLADDAFAQGKYIEPRDESALDLYRSALKLDPNSTAAQAGIRSVVDKLVERAEQALTAERLEEAVQGLKQAREIDPAHPRLQFLDVQIARERERMALDQERDTSNRVRNLVEQATVHIERQRLLRPPGDNARDTLLQARRLDPDDIAVVQGLREFATVLADAARKAQAAGDTAQAIEFIDAARKLGSKDPALAAVERAISEAARAASTRRDDVSRNAVPVEPTGLANTRAVQSPPNNAGSNIAPAPVQSPVPGTSNPVGTAIAPGLAADVLAAATLVRTKEVAPDYPTQAYVDGTEGWVDINFTISAQGVPEDLKIYDASPKRVFDRAALASLRQWRFEPIKENGVAVSRRANLRIRFQRQ
ncbi:MAG: TonB family protein [Steroidobacteraceae bacterium]